MDKSMIAERIIRARNTLGDLTLTGVENARTIVKVFDYLTETAELVFAEEKGEKTNAEDK